MSVKIGEKLNISSGRLDPEDHVQNTGYVKIHRKCGGFVLWIEATGEGKWYNYETMCTKCNHLVEIEDVDVFRRLKK